MKTAWLLTALMLAGWAGAQETGKNNGPRDPQPQTIYGDDDRLDLFQVKDPRLLAWADSTVALFPDYAVAMDAAAGTARLATRPYGPSNNLCPTEPFYDQQEGAFCSGFLVGQDIIATAGHCVTDENSCKNMRFVFSFVIHKEGRATPEVVPAGEVYGCKKLWRRQEEDTGADWALVWLDRRVARHKPLKLNRTGAIANGTKLVMIGHPSGLPTKVAGGNTYVRDASPKGYFVANTDSYHGNSGSVVLNARTGLVEGILVRGEADYDYVTNSLRDKNALFKLSAQGFCFASKRCPLDGCRGEDVTKIAALLPAMPWDWRPAEEPVAQGGAQARALASRPGPAFEQLLREAGARQ